MESVELVARGGDTDVGRGKADYDAIVEAKAREALASDPAAVVVLHTVAGSKDGPRHALPQSWPIPSSPSLASASCPSWTRAR